MHGLCRSRINSLASRITMCKEVADLGNVARLQCQVRANNCSFGDIATDAVNQRLNIVNYIDFVAAK